MVTLTVDLAATYLVGAGQWVVHNEDIRLPSISVPPGRRGIRVPRIVFVPEMVELTNRFGIEFKLLQEFVLPDKQWQWWLYSGTADRVISPSDWNILNMYHTHPSGKPIPSAADVDVLRNLMQKQKRVWGQPLQTTSGLIPATGPARGNLIKYDIHTTKAQWQQTQNYQDWVRWYNRSC